MAQRNWRQPQFFGGASAEGAARLPARSNRSLARLGPAAARHHFHRQVNGDSFAPAAVSARFPPGRGGSASSGRRGREQRAPRAPRERCAQSRRGGLSRRRSPRTWGRPTRGGQRGAGLANGCVVQSTASFPLLLVSVSFRCPVGQTYGGGRPCRLVTPTVLRRAVSPIGPSGSVCKLVRSGRFDRGNAACEAVRARQARAGPGPALGGSAWRATRCRFTPRRAVSGWPHLEPWYT